MSEAPLEFRPREQAVWLAALNGGEDLLSQLSAQLRSDDLCVHRLSRQWVAFTRRLQHHSTPSAFHHQVVSDLIPILNLIARRIEPQYADVQPGAVIRLEPNGRINTIILPSTGAAYMSRLPEPIDHESGADRLARLAWTRPEVMRVIRFRESPDRELWSGLYRVMEGISLDLGGAAHIAAHGWRPANWLKLFKRTANSEAAGATGRHGRPNGAPPENPMSIEEARRGMHHIYERWIDWKLSQR